MAREPLVTVVTPVYDGEKYLAECIESVLAQTYLYWDYVIVNNRSTDRSLEIAERYAKKDPRITVMTSDRFLDVMGSQNTAFRQVGAASSYCKMVHADDWLFPDCLRQMVELAEAHPSVGVVGSYRLDDVEVNCDGLPYPSTVVPGRQICRATLLGGVHVFGTATALLYRADQVRRRDPFFDPTDFHADAAACFEILRESDFGFVHQVLSFTRRHTETQTTFTEAMKTYLPSRIRHLQQYGPFYLTPPEYEQRLKYLVKDYYKSLSNSLLQGRGRNFWAYHRQQLSSRGYRLSWPRLIGESVLEARFALVRPIRAVRMALKALGRSG
jgi:glycosyltransferase involved in cell wall biosynthesis